MRLAVLGGRGSSTNILLNWLHDNDFQDVIAIVEDRVPRKLLVKNRCRRLGIFTTVGQLAFQGIIAPILQRLSRKRIREIMAEYGLRDERPGHVRVEEVESVNAERTIKLLQDLQPDIVIVNGTRIIREHVLRNLNCPVLNTHVGITPEYRGVHGGYWALWDGDPENFGVTLHLVDAGVDTGPVLAQVRTKPAARDNFATYPVLQQAVSLPALKASLSKPAELAGLTRVTHSEITKPSRQWYHPTLWQYLTGLFRGVK